MMGAEDILGLFALLVEGILLVIMTLFIQWYMDEDKNDKEEKDE